MIAGFPELQGGFIDDSPTLLLLIMAPDFQGMHFVLRDFLSRNAIVKATDSFYTGFCFGRYDLIAEVKTDTVRNAFNLAHDLQSMIVDTQAQACSSIILCHNVAISAGSRQHQPAKDGAIRSYSIFSDQGSKIDNLSVREGVSADDQNAEDKIHGTLFWNRSYYSHVLRLEGNRFDNVYDSIYSYRRSMGFPKDFCTFATLGFNCVDEVSQHPIRALINVKVCDEPTLDRIRREFPHAFLRFGYFDLVIPVEVSRLSEIQATISKTRQLLMQSQPSNRSATILCFVEPYEKLTG